MQDRKVLLERKVVKKAGQDVEVKLLPREVSNGEGRGVVTTVVEVATAKLVVVVALEDAEADEDIILEVDSETAEEVAVEVEVGAELVGIEVSCPTCRLSSSTSGCDLVSKCISPRCSNSRNWIEW